VKQLYERHGPTHFTGKAEMMKCAIVDKNTVQAEGNSSVDETIHP